MAMNYQNFASLGVNLNRQKYGPLDISSVFTSEADLRYYLSKGAETEGVSEYWYKNANEKIVPYPYEGQVIATVINDDVKVYVLRLDAESAFEAKAIEPEVDGKTIKLTNGKLELVGLPTDTSKVYVPSLVNGVLTWAEPDTSTAEGQQQAIDGLNASVASLGAVVNGKPAEGEEGTDGYVAPVVGLVEKVAALEAVDNATQAELDAYKEVVTVAIAAGVKEAKDYADANDANTVYDDTELAGRVKAIEDDYLKEADKYNDTDLQNRVKAIEDDYLKEADKYDDTKLAGRVTTVEGKVTALEEAVEAIDYVDAEELADALEPITTALGTKAAQSDLETLKGRVDTFFEGTGVENVIDTLEDLIKYINEHDDIEVSGILASIEAIENKLVLGNYTEGEETKEYATVKAYVEAAIEAIKIGDYAKAADLTELAGRVEVLEKKPFDTYATKTEVQDVADDLAEYVDSNNSALAEVKATADAAAVKTDVETALAGKVDNETLNNYYTSAEVDAKGYAVATEVAGTYATKSELTEAVEGIENDLLAYAKTADVAVELAKKVESATIAHAVAADPEKGIEAIPEGVTKDGTTIKIIVDAPTRAETTQMIADKVAAVTGGESAAAVKLLVEAETERSTAKDEAHDAALAKLNGEANVVGSVAEAKALAQKGVDDAAKVAADLVTANSAIADSNREIGVVKGSISDVNTNLTAKITALEGKDTTIEGNITALQTTVNGHTTTITEQGVAIKAIQDEDARLATLIQSNTDKFAGYYTKSEVDAAVITSGEVVHGDKDEVAIDNNKITVTVNSYTKGEVDNLLANLDQTELENGIAANKADITVLVGDDKDDNGKANKSIRAIAKEEVALIVDSAPEAFDTLAEIATWINNDDTGAAAMSAKIAEHTTVLAGIGGENQPVTVAAAIESAIAAIPALEAATAEKLGGIKSASGDNKVTVAEDGTASVGSVNVSSLTQTTSDVLILDGGKATV